MRRGVGVVQRLAERLDLGPHRVDVLGVLEDVRVRLLGDPESRDGHLPAQPLGVGDGRVQLGLGLLVPVLVESDFLGVAVVALGQRLAFLDRLVDLVALRAEPHQLDAGGVALPLLQHLRDLALTPGVLGLELLHLARDRADLVPRLLQPLAALRAGLAVVGRFLLRRSGLRGPLALP